MIDIICFFLDIFCIFSLKSLIFLFSKQQSVITYNFKHHYYKRCISTNVYIFLAVMYNNKFLRIIIYFVFAFKVFFILLIFVNKTNRKQISERYKF